MITNSTVHHIIRITNLCLMIERLGMTLEIGTDFSVYHRMRAEQKDRSPVYPMFDVTRSYVDETNGLWIAGRSGDGALQHTQAICMLDLQGFTLKEHFKRHKVKYLTPGLVDDIWSVEFDAPVALQKVTGRVCYHGEFWLNGGRDGYRGQGFSELLGRLIFELAQVNWAPDYMYCFVPSEVTLKGAPARYGYFHSAPGFWTEAGGKVLSKEHLVWMSAADIEALTALPLAATHEAFETDQPETLSSRALSIGGQTINKEPQAVAAE